MRESTSPKRVVVASGREASIHVEECESGRRLWAFRHGESSANKEGVVVSHPGPQAFTWAKLTDLGRDQAARAARAAELPADTVVVTSDFARAYETARIAADIWGTSAPQIDIRLRERNFGSLEGGPSHRYDEVWAADALGASLPDGVETVHQVAFRTQSLVTELLSLPGTCDIVLVAHGDVLQIAQTSINGTSASAHRALPHLGNAELRLLLPRDDSQRELGDRAGAGDQRLQPQNDRRHSR